MTDTPPNVDNHAPRDYRYRMSLPAYITYAPPIAQLIEEGGPERLISDLADGQTLRDIAGRIGCTRGVLTRYIAQLPPAIQQAIRQADLEGATAMAEEARQIADETAEDVRTMTKPMYVKDYGHVADLVDAGVILAAEKERIRVRQWMAERKDKDAWGLKPTTELTVNLSTIHLDALRQRSRHAAVGQAEPVVVIDAPTEPALPVDLSEFL